MALSLQCSQQKQEISDLKTELASQRLTIQSQAARFLELESIISKLHGDLSLALSENRRLSIDLTNVLARDSHLDHLVHAQQGAVASFRRDQRALAGELHARTMEREALEAVVQRQRVALRLEKSHADRAAAVVNSQHEWVNRAGGPTDGSRRDALPPGAPTATAMAHTLPAGPAAVFAAAMGVFPAPRVVSVPEYAAEQGFHPGPQASGVPPRVV
jgi:transcriptional regulator of acetoin/glycerol metabolism